MSDHAEKAEVELWWLVVAIAMVVAIVVGVGYCVYPPAQSSLFADTFDALNVLFSGLAFAVLIFTMLLQRQELKLQRQELKDTREELRGQKLQLEAQNRTFTKQNFEDSFFQLLRLHSELVNAIDLRRGPDKALGRDCFLLFVQWYKSFYGQSLTAPGVPTELDKVRNSYENFYLKYGHEVAHYFRTLYNIIKFIDRSEAEDKDFYTRLVKAQLSSAELVLLFYNGLSVYGSSKFKPFIEKYALLEHLEINHLANPHDQKPLYPPAAYGELSKM